MNHPKPNIIATWVMGHAPEKYLRLNEIINVVLREKLPDDSTETISDLAEATCEKVYRELLKKQEENEIDKLPHDFELNNDGGTVYIRSIYQDTSALEALKKLSPEEFEKFCAIFLKKMGAESADARGGDNDGGIDFYAFGLPSGTIGAETPQYSKTFLLGQAKRFTTGTTITETDLRKFVGACTLQSFKFRVDFPSKIGVLTPAVFAYWTTTDFHPDARLYARELGLWLLSGTALARLAVKLAVPIPVSMP